MINFKSNNLKNSNSPYLKQHADNPINWQVWSNDVLNYAIEKNKMLIISIGYTTCHWCHEMEKEVFENKEQIEVSKFYERLPKAHAIAIDNWLSEKIYHRKPESN